MELTFPTRPNLRSSDGAVAVLVAIIIPIAIVLISFVIDIGNGFYHQRHLQLQADAAALAGGQEFLSGNCSDANVVGRAFEYSGVPSAQVSTNTNWTGSVTTYSDPGAPYNAQIGNTSPNNIFEAINSKTYLPAGNNGPTDPTTYPSNSPCSDSLLDVKITQTNLPWYFQAGGFQYMNAHARVTWGFTGAGFLPLAVDETSPQSVWAYFVNEATGALITPMTANPVQLTNQGPVGGSGTYAGDDTWTNATVQVPINVPNVELIIALSGSKTDGTCTDQPVSCFNQNNGAGGFDLVNIQGYTTSGTGTATTPIVRSLTLPQTGTTCTSAIGSDAYFTNLSTGTCTVLVQTTIDFGANPDPSGTTVWAQDSGGNCYQLAYNTTGTYAGTWTGSPTVAAGGGADPLNIVVAKTCNNKSTPITGGTGESGSQSAFASTSTTAGTIDGVVLGQSGVEGANSYPINSTQTMSITADIGGSLQDEEGSASNPNPPLVELNFANNTSASQTGTIACPAGSSSGSNLTTALESGCPGAYAINGSAHGGADPSCTYINAGPGGNPVPPADCVQTANGVKNGPFDTGIQDRLLNASAGGHWYCANNWSDFNPSEVGDGLPANDDRLVTLFITPYNSFNGSGNNDFPILDGAYFYVMGFNKDTCKTDPADPQAAGNGNGHASGRIWGYFIKYTDPQGSPSTTTPCTDSALGACAIALTQ